MKHVTNTYDYRKDDAMNRIVLVFDGGTRREQWEEHLELCQSLIIGLPKATEHHSVDELVKMDEIGLYMLDDEVNPKGKV